MRKLVLGVMTLLLAVTVQAQPLARQQVENWLAAAAELEAWGEQQTQALPEVGFDAFMRADGSFDAPAWERELHQVMSAYPEVDRILKRGGFTDVAEWARVTLQVTKAYFTLHMAETGPEMEQYMQEAMRQLEAAAHIPPEQREMMRQQMQQTIGMSRLWLQDVSDADVALIREMRAEIEAYFEDGD